MEVLYSRYSRERHPHFQMKTIIYDDNGLKKVMKQAINPSGLSHIEGIMHNYKQLKEDYKEDTLLEPDLQGDSIFFDYINGNSLDELAVKAALNKNMKDFLYFVELYKKFLNEIALHHYTTFRNTNEFITFFKKEYPLEGLQAFIHPNIDLNFDNVFVLENENFRVIDYEWVFNFPIPVEFVAFRAINTFYYAHYSLLNNFVEISELFRVFGITPEKIEIYTEMSISFADFVGTNQAIGKQNGYLKKNIPYKFREPEVLSSQLFFSKDEEHIFSEENSIKINITAQKSIFKFSLGSGMNHFRFDPAEKRCIIILEKITLLDSMKRSLEINDIHSNASFSVDSKYFFSADDPQMVFNTKFGELASEVLIYLRYIPFPEDDFFLEVGDYCRTLADSINTMKGSFTAEKEDFESQILKSQMEIKENELLLQDMINENDCLKAEKAELNTILKEQSNTNEKLNTENSRLINENEILKSELSTRMEFINEVKNTYWWRAHQKTKSLVEKISFRMKGKRK